MRSRKPRPRPPRTRIARREPDRSPSAAWQDSLFGADMQSSARQYLTMMSLNLWRGGEAAHAEPETSRRCTLRVLEAVGADVIGLQETNVRTARYADPSRT